MGALAALLPELQLVDPRDAEVDPRRREVACSNEDDEASSVGRNSGQRWITSPRVTSSFVAGAGVPPATRHSRDVGARRIREQDDPVPVPRRAAAQVRVADDLDGAALELQLLELALGEEAEGSVHPATRRGSRRSRFPGGSAPPPRRGPGARSDYGPRPTQRRRDDGRREKGRKNPSIPRPEAARIERTIRVRERPRGGGQSTSSRGPLRCARRRRPRRSPRGGVSRDAAAGAAIPAAEPSAIHLSSLPTSAALCQRSSGSLARHVFTTRSSAGGDIGCDREIGGGSRRHDRRDQRRLARPENAFLPVAIS